MNEIDLDLGRSYVKYQDMVEFRYDNDIAYLKKEELKAFIEDIQKFYRDIFEV